ncbi:MAG: polyphosphate polymerase domain-containing protein [Candidatus Methanoperedens sp.]|nr:polyphosphate polymerase domain-containing protein [Candidatus Methanoperedens sp.]
MDALFQALLRFEPISLEQMDNVRLMDRTDTKFIFRIEQLPIFLGQISGHYRILEVANSRISRYETLYFDTEDFQLYLKHQNGKLNRYKVRYRRYVESDLNFFEIKFKNNRGRTIKDRIRRNGTGYKIEDEVQHLIHEKTPLDPGSLIPKLWVNYSRITLVNKFSRERLTIDVNLNFRNEAANKYFNNLVIAEVKQEKSSPSPFIRVMRQNHIREGSISKYCLGVISLYEQVKKNNFKPRLLIMNKVMS